MNLYKVEPIGVGGVGGVSKMWTSKRGTQRLGGGVLVSKKRGRMEEDLTVWTPNWTTRVKEYDQFSQTVNGKDCINLNLCV